MCSMLRISHKNNIQWFVWKTVKQMYSTLSIQHAKGNMFNWRQIFESVGACPRNWLSDGLRSKPRQRHQRFVCVTRSTADFFLSNWISTSDRNESLSYVVDGDTVKCSTFCVLRGSHPSSSSFICALKCQHFKSSGTKMPASDCTLYVVHVSL